MTAAQATRVIGPADDLDLWRRAVAAVVGQGGRITGTGEGDEGVTFIRFQAGAAVLRLDRSARGVTLEGDSALVQRVAAALGR